MDAAYRHDRGLGQGEEGRADAGDRLPVHDEVFAHNLRVVRDGNDRHVLVAVRVVAGVREAVPPFRAGLACANLRVAHGNPTE